MLINQQGIARWGMIVKVALNIPFTDLFDYQFSNDLVDFIKPGIRVLVPLGSRRIIGVVTKTQHHSEFENLKSIIEIVDDVPIFSQRLLFLTRWISEYYLCSWGEVLDASLPTGLKPKIIKNIVLDNTISAFSLLNESEKKWLLSISGEKETKIQKRRDYQGYRSLFFKSKKNRLLKVQYVVEKAYDKKQVESWLELNSEIATQTKTKKGSKANRIFGLLQENKRIRKDLLLSEIENSRTVLNQLIRKEAVIEKLIVVQNVNAADSIREERFITLNREQEEAFKQISAGIKQKKFQSFLLHGITGSGKTEVFLYAVKETILQQRTALILIPEISLTPQAVKRFRDRFGDRIAVLHSGMAEKERCAEWWKVKEKKCDIVVGTRSAIFAPLENIGLIVVDEEHDSSYKQQETPYYNARDVAVKLASEQQSIIILGSATPSIESYFNAKNSKYELLVLSERANQKPLPSTEVINLKEESRQAGVFYLSKYLVAKLKENYLEGKQALIFLNRRGYAAFLSCTSCDLPVLCDNCSIALTWHKKDQRLVCHHCGFSRRFVETCPNCQAKTLRLEGIGTQRVERDLKILFQKARFLRMDRDTVRKKGTLEANMDLINQQQVDFIIGTQLISKGHDFKHIGIVCIILADMSLNIPDFRSSERSFQLISQVSGRAGRDEQGKGRALIQSYNPNHFAIKSAKEHDFTSFYENEIALRQMLENPPFKRQILLKISDQNPDHVKETAQKLGSILGEYSTNLKFQILGPIESPIQKINKRFYWQILLKGDSMFRIKKLIHYLFWEQNEWRVKGATRVVIDVDPYMML